MLKRVTAVIEAVEAAERLEQISDLRRSAGRFFVQPPFPHSTKRAIAAYCQAVRQLNYGVAVDR
jgi:hypothetical protein